MGNDETQYLSSVLPRELEMVWAVNHTLLGASIKGEIRADGNGKSLIFGRKLLATTLLAGVGV